jgi:hypothetical protein
MTAPRASEALSKATESRLSVICIQVLIEKAAMIFIFLYFVDYDAVLMPGIFRESNTSKVTLEEATSQGGRCILG